MLEPSQRDWCRPLLDTLGIPAGLLLPLGDTGAIKGAVGASAGEETGLEGVPIVSAIGHDSAAAVAAIPGFDENGLYVSIGTNISMGLYRQTPALDAAAFDGGFKNTGGEGGRIIVYRDFPAAWMLNRLYAEWVKTDPGLSFDDLDALAAGADGGALFDIEDPLVQQAGGSMSRVIAGLVEKTGRPAPASREEFAASVMESIALRVRYYADGLARMRGRDFDGVWLISGGTRYKTLVSLIAGALERPVYAGLPYATLTGNAVSQFYALGRLDRDRYGDAGKAGGLFTEIRPGIPGRRNWPESLEWAAERGIL
jgi:sugar (pentulose or hexulose) kinase